MKSGRKKKCDNFDKDVIHRVMLNMFEKQELVTLKKLRSRLHILNDINISKTTLWKTVRSLGFTFKKAVGGKNNTM